MQDAETAEARESTQTKSTELPELPKRKAIEELSVGDVLDAVVVSSALGQLDCHKRCVLVCLENRGKIWMFLGCRVRHGCFRARVRSCGNSRTANV